MSPAGDWTKKPWVCDVTAEQQGVFLSAKEDGNPATAATRLPGLAGTTLSEISDTGRDKHCAISLTRAT